MFWYITFPNEPNHPLNEKMIDFKTIINLATGKVSSQISQMSRIHKMMKRYSVIRANQFLSRFPNVYWAPDKKYDDHTLYYHYISVKSAKHGNNEYVAWWKTEDLRRICFIVNPGPKHKSFQVVNVGSEFKIYSDSEARFDEDILSSGITRKKLDSQRSISLTENGNSNTNKHLREILEVDYSWRQDALPKHVKWIKTTLINYLNPDTKIVSIRNTYFEIRDQERIIGLIMIMDYCIYLTQLTENISSGMIFNSNRAQIIAAGLSDGIRIIFTN